LKQSVNAAWQDALSHRLLFLTDVPCHKFPNLLK
jgi:hypothetical protein